MKLDIHTCTFFRFWVTGLCKVLSVLCFTHPFSMRVKFPIVLADIVEISIILSTLKPLSLTADLVLMFSTRGRYQDFFSFPNVRWQRFDDFARWVSRLAGLSCMPSEASYGTLFAYGLYAYMYFL